MRVTRLKSIASQQHFLAFYSSCNYFILAQKQKFSFRIDLNPFMPLMSLHYQMTLQLPLSQQNFCLPLLKSILVPLNFTISIFYKSCYDKVKCKKCAYKIQVWVIISITHLYEGRTYSTLQNTYTVCNVTKKGTIYCNMEIDFLREITS